MVQSKSVLRSYGDCYNLVSASLQHVTRAMAPLAGTVLVVRYSTYLMIKMALLSAMDRTFVHFPIWDITHLCALVII